MNEQKRKDSLKTKTGQAVYLLTGATSGIGRAIAQKLAVGVARVGIVCRNEGKGEKVREEIESSRVSGSVEVVCADLSSQQDIVRMATEVNNRFNRLDALINNAGVFAKKRQVTADGFELQFAVNYLAPFRLIRCLYPLLEKSAPARIVNVASMEHRIGKLYPGDLQLENNYLGTRAYRQSKLAIVLFSLELARRIAGSGVSVNALHPGIVYTKLVHSISPLAIIVKKILKTPEEGARGPVYLATSPKLDNISGAYFRSTHRSSPARRARNPEKARWLWRRTEELLGLEPWPDFPKKLADSTHSKDVKKPA